VGTIPYKEVLFLVLLVASLYDFTRYKVPNALFVPALLISLIGHLEAQGFKGLYLWLAGIFIPFILCYLLYRCRMLGASDVKMFSVIGSFVDLRLLYSIMVVSLVLGAAMAIGKMIIRRNFIRRFRQLFNYAYNCILEKRLKPYYDREAEGKDGIIPFTIAISFATILCVY